MIYFVRHGDKDKCGSYNASLDICDEPLSDKGKEDAERIAGFFIGIEITKIYVSEYARAQQTAVPTAKEKGLPVIVDARVNEINNGELRYMSEDEAAAAYPALWGSFSRHLRDVKFPGGESGEDVRRRQDSFLTDMKKEQGNVLVVSHDGYIRLLVCNILGIPVYMRYKFSTNMGGISSVYYDDGENEWKIASFNQQV